LLMRNSRKSARADATTSEPDALTATIEALGETLASTKTRRVRGLEAALTTASAERKEAARLYRVARAEADKVKPGRTIETPHERRARDAVDGADKATQRARAELRHARQEELPAFRDAIEPHLRDLVQPLSRAADLIDRARAVLGEIDNYSMRNGVPVEPLAPRFAGTALLRRELARLPGAQPKAERARATVAAMSRAVEKANEGV
jgi:hypothetical protein